MVFDYSSYIFKLFVSDKFSDIYLWPNVSYVCVMVFNATFNNISAISWRPVLLAEETGVPTENHRPVARH